MSGSVLLLGETTYFINRSQISQSISSATNEREKQRSGQALLENNCRNAERELTKAQSQFKDRQNYEARKKEVQGQIEDKEASVKVSQWVSVLIFVVQSNSKIQQALEEDARKATEPIQRTEQAFAALKQSNEDQSREMMMALTSIRSDIKEIESATRDIESYVYHLATFRYLVLMV